MVTRAEVSVPSVLPVRPLRGRRRWCAAAPPNATSAIPRPTCTLSAYPHVKKTARTLPDCCALKTGERDVTHFPPLLVPQLAEA